jgi:hypothetical protein
VEPYGFAKVPAAQGEHDEAIEVELNEPGRQRIQLREVKLAKVPGEQEKGYMRRILLLTLSATITLPEVSTVHSDVNRAAEARGRANPID